MHDEQPPSHEGVLAFVGARLGDHDPQTIVVRDGRIESVGAQDIPTGATVVDVDGLTVLPAFVDIHTHLREPGREDAETIETGTAAAAVGGFSAVFAMANTKPVTDTAELASWMYRKGQSVGHCDVMPVGAVTKGLAGEELAELGLMHRSPARVSMFSDDGLAVADSLIMRRALEYVKAFGGVIAQHAQDPRLAGTSSCCHEGEVSGRTGLPGWPGVAEDVIVARDIMLAKHTDSRVHVCHISTAESVELVRWAKSRGVKVTAEVTPHHLLLPVDLVASYDSVFKVNPPLRPTEDIEACRAGLLDGTIDCVATDHAPHARHDKERAFPEAAFGMVGLETSFAIIHHLFVRTGQLNWADVARVMSTAPAHIGGISRVGELMSHGRPIAAGEPANLVFVDPTARWTVDRQQTQSKSTNNPFHGRELTGKAVLTYRRGLCTAQHGTLTTTTTGASR